MAFLDLFLQFLLNSLAFLLATQMSNQKSRQIPPLLFFGQEFLDRKSIQTIGCLISPFPPNPQLSKCPISLLP